jgi:glutamate/tyrosine decarboxylase-like PLP-dependent enzyme
MEACARDSFLTSHPDLPSGYSIAEYGFPSCLPSPAIVVLAVSPHASFLKAAAVSGIGRSNVINMPHATGDENGFDLAELQKRLQSEKERGAKVIVGITMGEVNTGGFGRNNRQAIDLARKFGAWVHVDGGDGVASISADCSVRRLCGSAPRAAKRHRRDDARGQCDA